MPQRPIVLLQDFHPLNHISFKPQHDGIETVPWAVGNITDHRYCKDSILFQNPKTADERTDDEQAYQEVDKKACVPIGPDVVVPVFPSHCRHNARDTQLIDGLCEAAGGTLVPVFPQLSVRAEGSEGSSDVHESCEAAEVSSGVRQNQCVFVSAASFALKSSLANMHSQ